MALKLSVRGGTPEQHKRIRNITRWIVPYLLGSRQTSFLSISIILSKTIHKNHYGECEVADDNIRPRDFTIYLTHDISSRILTRILAHELIHVKQFVKNEMFDYASSAYLSRWKGKTINTKGLDYRNVPWEREALKFEGRVAKAYQAANK